MKNLSFQDFIPFLVSGSVGVFVLVIGISYFYNREIRATSSLRIRILEGYSNSRESTVARAKLRAQMNRSVFDSFGNSLVKDQYSSKLKRMLVTSGDWENRDYSSLVRRKLFLGVGGFLLTFILLLLNNLAAAPLVLVTCLTLYFLPNISNSFRKVFGKKYTGKLEHLLDSAGKWTASGYIDLVKRKFIFASFGFVVSYLYLLINTGSINGFFGTLAAITVGFFIPDILLQNKVLKRKEMIANTLPDALDILQMCVGAGLAFPAALARVAESQSGPIAEEFARVTTEVQLGKSRSEALASMADRTQEKSVEKFVNSMQQVTTFGIPVLNVIVEQAKEMRMVRREKARERAQKVPVKILGPIMVFFLPSVLIIVIGPAAVSILSSLG